MGRLRQVLHPTRRGLLRALPRQPRHQPGHRQAAPAGTRPTPAPGHQDRGVRRPLPLPAICVTALRRRYRQQEVARENAGEAWHDTGMIFTNRYGLRIEPRNVNRSYDSRIARASVPKITVHDARRTLRFAPGRPGRASPDRDGDPQTRRLLDHDGDLQPGLVQSHPGSPAEARPEPRSMSRCCTSLLYKIRNGHPEDSEWPLTCVGTAGFEPTTPCYRPQLPRPCHWSSEISSELHRHGQRPIASCRWLSTEGGGFRGVNGGQTDRTSPGSDRARRPTIGVSRHQENDEPIHRDPPAAGMGVRVG